VIGYNRAMQLTRASGVLLHPTSLPGGRLGPEAYRFVDWLAEAGQSWWQVLPLGPPDRHGSPYAAQSAFAGSPALVADPGAEVAPGEIEAFVAAHPYWIGGYAARAGTGAVAAQVRFQREWDALRAYARSKGVRVMGDLPIYVAPGGIDEAEHPELFRRGLVAGAPPDAYSATGQLWGNPLYDWGALRRQGYRWWTERFRRTFELVDLTRIDHFRGFVSYWAVAAGRRTAKSGRWLRGPGGAPFRAAEAELGRLEVVVENLGVITPAVERLRRELRLPGMVVLQFGFGGSASNPHRLEHHERNAVVYTGTHDHPPAAAWWATATVSQRRALAAATAAARLPGDEEPHWQLVCLALSSRAALSIVPAQDVLGLGGEARMNTPGRADGNWRWQLEPGALTAELAERLREATRLAGR
jgi:4-alpha-glucanotransferase